MQIKRFRAATMTEALQRVKDDFGPEAVILSARSMKPANPLLGPWTKARVEVTAAKEAPRSNGTDAPSGPSRIPAMPPPLQEPVQLVGPGTITPVEGSVPPAREYALPQSYLKKLFVLYQLMRGQGVDPGVAFYLVKRIHGRAARETHVSDEALRDMLTQIVQRHLRMLIQQTARDDGPRRILVVGPTGAGKTTTVAKIAAIQSRHRRRSVGLISLDSHRIGGMAQLEIFSRILDIPLLTAADPTGFGRAIRSFRDADTVLIDTAGFHPRQTEQMTALQQMVAIGCSFQVHLVVSAGSAFSELLEIVDGYRCLPIHRLIVSKLDEALRSGNLLNLIIRSRIPISFMCNGPGVPEDIQPATAARILDTVMRPELEEAIWSVPPEKVARQMTLFERQLQRTTAAHRVERDVPPDRRGLSEPLPFGASQAPWHPYGREGAL